MREQRGRLGKYVRNARVAAGYGTLASWAVRLGISERTLGNLERGHGAGPNTISAVENALGWEPGSADRISRGGEPTYLQRQPRYTNDPERQEVWDELSDYFPDDERVAIVEEVIRRRRGTGGAAATGT